MSTPNTTAPENATELDENTALEVLLCIVACLLLVFVCTGNALTIAAILQTPFLRTLANTYVASLAVADFVVGLTLILLALFLLSTTRIHLFYRFINLCVLMQGLMIGMSAVSAIHMAIISVDRYLYISHPYFYQRVVNIKVVMTCVGGAWTFGIVYSLLPQLIYIPYGDMPLCDVTEVLPIEYLFYSTSSIYWSLVTVIVVMYSLVLHTALKQGRAIHTSCQNGSQTQGKTKSIKRSTIKSIKFFMTVFGVFFVCLTPVLICMGADFYVDVPANLYRFFNLLAFTNSGMNFIIYGVLNRQFRYAFYKVARIRSLCLKTESPVFTLTNSADFTATHF